MMVDPNIWPPVLVFVSAGALFFLDWDIEDLVTPVSHESEPGEDLDTLERRLVQWVLVPVFNAKLAATPHGNLEFEDVRPTYNFNLAKVEACRRYLATIQEAVRDIRVFARAAALALLPVGAYASALVADPSAGGWFEVIAQLFLSVVSIFLALAIKSFLGLREARTVYDQTLEALRSSLGILQTIQMSGRTPP